MYRVERCQLSSNLWNLVRVSFDGTVTLLAVFLDQCEAKQIASFLNEDSRVQLA